VVTQRLSESRQGIHLSHGVECRSACVSWSHSRVVKLVEARKTDQFAIVFFKNLHFMDEDRLMYVMICNSYPECDTHGIRSHCGGSIRPHASNLIIDFGLDFGIESDQQDSESHRM
jgi:hypothetical protein